MADMMNEMDEPIVWGAGNWFHGGGCEDVWPNCATGVGFACRSGLLNSNDAKCKTQRTADKDKS